MFEPELFWKQITLLMNVAYMLHCWDFSAAPAAIFSPVVVRRPIVILPRGIVPPALPSLRPATVMLIFMETRW